jgi:hypothetical protein
MIKLNTVSLLQQYQRQYGEKSPNYGSILAVEQGKWRLPTVYTTGLVAEFEQQRRPCLAPP